MIAVAHNFQGYDSYFILEHFYKEYICPHQIVNSAKILSIQVGGYLKFIDSMRFLQMALAILIPLTLLVATSPYWVLAQHGLLIMHRIKTNEIRNSLKVGLICVLFFAAFYRL